MKKRLLCLLLCLLLTACASGKSEGGEPGLQFYYPALAVSYAEGAFCTQEAPESAAELAPEELARTYLASTPPENAGAPIPQEWTLERAGMQEGTLELVFTGRAVAALRRSVAAVCMAKTLLQIEQVQRVSISAPGLSAPIELTENDIFLRDTAMLPQEEVLVLYLPDEDRRYLERETRLVEVMDEAEKPTYLVRQLLERGNCIPKDTELLGLQIGGGVCIVNLSAQFESGMEDSFAAQRLAVYSIVDTLTELPEITTVDLWVSGAPLENLSRLTLGTELRRDETLLAIPEGEEMVDVTLYPPLSGSGLLVPIPQMVEQTPSRRTAELALNSLLAYEGGNGVLDCIPEGTKLLSLRVEDGVCAVDLSAEFLDGCTSAEEEKLAVRSIVATMYALPEINSVELFVEGIEPAYRDEGLRTVRRSETEWFAP